MTEQPQDSQPEELEVDEPELLDEPTSPAGDRGGRGIFGALRWVMRGVLLVMLLACLLTGWWGRRPAGGTLAPESFAVVVTLDEGANYGEAEVHVGLPPSGPALSDDDLRQAIRTALSGAASRKVLVQAAGGVSIREVERVQKLLQSLSPADQPLQITLGLYRPPAAEKP